MNNFTLSLRSEKNLQGVHPDLVKTVRLALTISEVDFCVVEGIRTLERQIYLKNQGSSKTLNSRHLTGHAVDLAPLISNHIPWKEWRYFLLVARAMKEAAGIEGIPIIWGGDWILFKDGVHFELPSNVYIR